MKRLINALLILWLGLFSLNAFPQTGVYYNPDRDGEGIVAFTDDERIVFYVYTYGAELCATERVEPLVIQEVCTNNGQRWFFGADPWNGRAATGFLFATEGVEYPKGKPDPSNPYGVIVGEPTAVGFYVIDYTELGYRLAVVPFGVVDPDDEIYNRVYNFSGLLFAPELRTR